MGMNRFAWRLGLALLVPGLVACNGGEQANQREAVRPVKTLLLEDAAGVERSFPASIEASRRVDLSFRVPGKLETLQVQEGDDVEAGQVLATLDPRDYELALQDAEAEYSRAAGDWERAKVLVVDGHLSRTDFDKYESIFQQALAARDQARLNLSYTELKAPIDGTVARRYIQNFEEVSAKQEVFALRDNSELEVRVNIPEQVMTLLALNVEEGTDEGLFVSFPGSSDERFPLRTKEIATRADPKTQTFEARMTFDAPQNLNVLPGMSARVTADIEALRPESIVITLPAAAVDRRTDEPRLWLYDSQAGSARPVAVEIGPVIGGEVEILSGVGFGDHIIVAGTGDLDESMQLYEMRKVEQAE